MGNQRLIYYISTDNGSVHVKKTSLYIIIKRFFTVFCENITCSLCHIFNVEGQIIIGIQADPMYAIT